MQNTRDKKEIEIPIKDMEQYPDYSDVLNKITRISSALYMITDHIKDVEPIKDMIRSSATMLIKDTPRASIGQIPSSVVSAHIATVRSLLDMATMLNMISSENTTILFEAIRHFQIAFETHMQSLKKEAPATLMRELFGGDQVAYLPKEETAHKNLFAPKVSSGDGTTRTKTTTASALPQGIFKGTPGELMQRLAQTGMSDRNSHKGQVNSKGQNDKRHQKIADIVLKNERRSTIIKIIKDNGEVGIKDITEAIKNVSGKTIQRELATLVEEGILKKIGNKRWSRYTIKA